MDEDARANVSFLLRCWVCHNRFLAPQKDSAVLFAPGVPCVNRGKRYDNDVAVYLAAIVVDRRSGVDTLEEQLQEAIDLLPVDEKPLAEFLIDLLS